MAAVSRVQTFATPQPASWPSLPTAVAASAPAAGAEDAILAPAARKLAEENGIDPNSVKGTGKDGRLIKDDVIQWMSVTPKPSERKKLYGQEERIKMTRLRMTIAKRLKQAQENAAMLTTFNEVDMNSVIEMRKEHQEDFQNQFGIPPILQWHLAREIID